MLFNTQKYKLKKKSKQMDFFSRSRILASGLSMHARRAPRMVLHSSPTIDCIRARGRARGSLKFAFKFEARIIGVQTLGHRHWNQQPLCLGELAVLVCSPSFCRRMRAVMEVGLAYRRSNTSTTRRPLLFLFANGFLLWQWTMNRGRPILRPFGCQT